MNKYNGNTEQFDAYRRDIARLLAILPKEAVAELMANDEYCAEIVEAGAVSPELMEKIEQVLDSYPSNLSKHDVEEAQRIGDELESQLGYSCTGASQVGTFSLLGHLYSAACQFGRSFPEFMRQLIGYSQPLTPLPAAAGTATLSASMDRFRGGMVSLALAANGAATLTSEFQHPSVVYVSLYDSAQKRLVEFVDLDSSGAIVRNELQVKKGISSTRIRVSLLSSGLEDLLLLVRHADE